MIGYPSKNRRALSTLLEAGRVVVSLVEDCFLAWFHWSLATGTATD